MKRTHPVKILAALAAGLVLAACANQQEPAKKLLGEVETAITAAGADAQQYAPEQVASVNQKLADLKTAFAKQDYQTVITGGPALLAEAKGLADAAAAKKKEELETLNAKWTAVSASVPQQVAAIEARLATIAKTKKLPKGVTKDGLAAAKAGLGELQSGWSEATAAFGSGNVRAALDKATGVKAKANEIAAALGVATG